MKLLCLSDLHLRQEAVVDAIDRKQLAPFLEQIAAMVAEVSSNAVVVDTACSPQMRLLFATLRTLIPTELPVIVALGNHEFWGRTFEVTLEKLREQTLTDPNIFYLDLIGAVELGWINFVGGSLFFDGSMRVRDALKLQIKICLVKNGYFPGYTSAVFREIMSQVENFKENME